MNNEKSGNNININIISTLPEKSNDLIESIVKTILSIFSNLVSPKTNTVKERDLE